MVDLYTFTRKISEVSDFNQQGPSKKKIKKKKNNGALSSTNGKRGLIQARSWCIQVKPKLY